MNISENNQFGRLYAPDPRDKEYLLKAPTLRSYLIPTKHWKSGPVTDQGKFPHCVGHAWRQFLEASPVRRGERNIPSPDKIYTRAQCVDEWDGESYDGTSIRAGAKVLVMDNLIKEYRWAGDIDTAKKFVLTRGPLVVGTDWFVGMSRPLVIKHEHWLELSGEHEGGHAYVLIGYSGRQRAFRMINSWGNEWASAGRAWLSLDNAEQLLFRMNGEACSAIEN